MAIKNRQELERCRASQHSLCSESRGLWTEKRKSESHPWCMISSSALARRDPWSPHCLSISQKLWFSIGLSVCCRSRWHESVTALACRAHPRRLHLRGGRAWESSQDLGDFDAVRRSGCHIPRTRTFLHVLQAVRNGSFEPEHLMMLERRTPGKSS